MVDASKIAITLNKFKRVLYIKLLRLNANLALVLSGSIVIIDYTFYFEYCILLRIISSLITYFILNNIFQLYIIIESECFSLLSKLITKYVFFMIMKLS